MSLLDVLERYSVSFYEVAQRAGHLRFLAELYRNSATRKLGESDRGEFSAFLDSLKAECDLLGLRNVGDLVAHRKSNLVERDADYTYAELWSDLDAVTFSFRQGLQDEVFIRLPRDREPFFQQDALFGPEVGEAFPSSADDIQHAGTCYALDQHTACVFHLMRVLERGLRALADKVGVPYVDSQNQTWATMIDQILKAVKNGQGIDAKERQVYAEAAAHLGFVKDAWRNPVSHVRGVYDKGQAESVLMNVRGFMQALATAGLSEPEP